MTDFRPGTPLTPYEMRRREAITRAASRLDGTASEIDAIRAELARVQKAYRALIVRYASEYRAFARLVREARKAGVPSTAVARWSGFHQGTVYRIMHTSQLPSAKRANSLVVHQTRPPTD
jgi:hypothetical protein